MDKLMDELYEMKLHEILSVPSSNVEVLRVPGGWIYTTYSTKNHAPSSAFVPFDNEFKN